MRDYKEELIDRIEEAEFELMLEKYQEDLSNACLKAYEQACARGEVEDMPEEIKEKVLKYINEYPCQSEKKRHPCRPLRYVLIIAATIAIVFSMLLTAQAVGYDVFGVLGRWTDTVFHFGNNTTERIIQPETSSAELSELYETLIANNISVGLAPTWIPDGFTTAKIDVSSSELQINIVAEYQKRHEKIVVSIVQRLNDTADNTIFYEKDKCDSEAHSSTNLTYYIFANQNKWVGICQNGCNTITVQTDASKENLIDIFNSIEGDNNA